MTNTDINTIDVPLDNYYIEYDLSRDKYSIIKRIEGYTYINIDNPNILSHIYSIGYNITHTYSKYEGNIELLELLYDI